MIGRKKRTSHALLRLALDKEYVRSTKVQCAGTEGISLVSSYLLLARFFFCLEDRA